MPRLHRVLAALSIAALGLVAVGCEAPGATDEPGTVTDTEGIEDSDEATGGAGTDTQLDVEGGPAADDDTEAGTDG